MRGEFSALTKAEAKAKLGIPVNVPLVVSVWGSLGARVMNERMAELIALAGEHPGFRLIHSAGKNGYEKFVENLKEQGVEDPAKRGADVRPYIYDMPTVMAAADLVLCRAGASTLAELTYLGKPAVLVPSPNVTNNHQERNARVLEQAGGAKVIVESDCTAEGLLGTIRDLLSDSVTLTKMEQNMKACGVPDATERIADMALEMIRAYQKYPEIPRR